jgi:hypothetical protein
MKNTLKILLLIILVLSGCRKTTVKEVKKLSPVPIYFVSNLDTDSSDGVTIGRFHYTGKIGDKISIEKYMSESNKIRSILHEIKHAKCLSEGCECYEDENKVLSEEHAYKFVLTWLLIYQQKDLLRDEMIKLQDVSESKKLKEHKVAAINVRRSQLWKVCKLFLEEE